MKIQVLASLLVGLILTIPSVKAQDTGTVTDTTAVLVVAKKAAMQWLALVDNGDYEASWDSASVAFRKAVTEDDWKTAVMKARTPFEPFGKRLETTSMYLNDPPNAPPGTYAIFIFKTRATNSNVVETVSMTTDTDSTWRAGGYFVRPVQ